MTNRWFGRTAGRGAPATVGAVPDDVMRPAGDGRTDPAADDLAGPAAPAGPPAPTPLLTIDALGRKCPIPIIMLAERIHEVPIGEIIAVLADDPAAENDVPAWCLMKSHDHVLTQPLERGWSILIRRGY
jgi:tRNA 2-thiouridine synthesizing protein A